MYMRVDWHRNLLTVRKRNILYNVSWKFSCCLYCFHRICLCESTNCFVNLLKKQHMKSNEFWIFSAVRMPPCCCWKSAHANHIVDTFTVIRCFIMLYNSVQFTYTLTMKFDDVIRR